MTTSRTRSERRSTRTAIWRGGSASAPAEQPQLEHGRRTAALSGGARLVSGVIVISMTIVLLVFFLTDPFYIKNAQIGGMEFLSISDVYTIAGIDGWHLFWIEPEEVRARLRAYATIADASVQVGWPPAMVQIVIEEREPALVWVQAGQVVWIDLQGRVMSQRADVENLLRIEAESIEADPLGPNTRIPVDVVSGALQLRELLPDIEVLRYHPIKGLGYNDPRGWQAWFGSGANMPEKLLIYNAVVADIQTRGQVPTEINVSNPDAAVICCTTP
ncbi:MAG: FtsQ-type POTRA domain-containing protein [Chloroflexota bacterium]|nr:FtsQ-type POTRA domain-containing protein [Chloroflexota bacterium]